MASAAAAGAPAAPAAAIPVHDEEGTLLAYVKVGDTKADALARLTLEGMLVDKDGIALLDTDLLAKEGGPYVFTSEPLAKQKLRKNLTTILKSGDFQKVNDELLYVAGSFIGEKPDDPKSYRVPATSLDGTWNEQAMKDELRKKREVIRGRLAKYKKTDRQAVIVGVRLGTGFGKTHVLTGAPEWLNALGIYVTYNMIQKLTIDKADPVRSILIRLILALHGCGSPQCDEFLTSEVSNQFLQAPLEPLLGLFLYNAKAKAQGEDIVIGVDELRDLGAKNAQIVMSVLAEVSAMYLRDTNSMCTVLVSSLATETFETLSGRPVEDWVPNRPDMEALGYFAKCIKPEKRAQAVSLVNAVSGGHMRSIVVAFRLFMEDSMEASVRWMFNKMKSRMGAKLKPKTLKDIAKYTKECMVATEPPDCPPEVELVADGFFAIPPVFLMLAYEERSQQTHLENLLSAFSLFDGGAAKQLDNVAKHYDLFRSSLGLPVVPGQVVVHDRNGRENWYKQLTFPTDLFVSEEALLKQKGTQIFATDEVPRLGHCYHPQVSNHPWIDRAYVATHPDGQFCLVLSQDTVNAADFASACEKLNMAATMLTKSSTLKKVLLIVHVIGAGELTRAQEKLNWPFILIRCRKEVSMFYSVNFGDMVWFSRERHLLSLR